MPTPHPPRPPYPPPGGVPGESDENLATRLRGRSDGEVAQSVALLMARHWQPARDYAAICLASPADLASMVTAAAFHQVLDRLALGEPALALRPRMLVAVRETVRVWSAEDRISSVLPELQKPSGGRGIRTTKSMTPENRRLAERSFQALPGLSRCLLWHTEVEAESITVPAALLGMDTDTASVELEQAREKFREGCVHAHRELAPSKDCRFYNRLLDVPIRRGGALLPDVQQHLAECPYCRSAAEQLSHFEGGLGALLAEAVLGWGARRYLDSRPARARQPTHTSGSARHGGGRPRILPRIPLPGRRPPGALRNSRALLTGVGVASAGLLATLFAAGLWSHDDGVDPAASTSAGGGTAPGVGSQSSPGTAQLPMVPGRSRLHSVGADLCLDITGKVKAGAGTELAACSDAGTQQWSFEKDGLLRSGADPGLCLDSHVDAGVAVLGKCAAGKDKRGDDVRYDLTAQGELLPRWDEHLALAATAGKPGADIVVKVRDGSPAQRWLADPTAMATPGSLSITGTETPAARPAELSESA
ncbi:RICIN domain-containing protein [Streptomyces sp. TLI_185]|uniref:RICIN domain-containing protein n=1 Tax=Streptomyces sp. TLI_185 TaxID=2485151 RepID=UPI000F4DEE16|nr:RICIN domain-containing protein [Streptomyces sp. TLI_185]RPF38780.1 ricin-type beta-trefoil lectin protein [Streptomyces sp. TLI_185]